MTPMSGAEFAAHKLLAPAAFYATLPVAPRSPLAKVQGLTALDPRNNMPVEPNQLPFPGQRKLLPTDRQSSNIPKGGTDATWLYPSQQMIFNALKRKGKGEDLAEDDMVGFIMAHNTMNEMTWQRVAEWERLHEKECGSPALLRFRGRPDQMSPRAWFNTTVLGEKGHFDRHDWFVDRCGKEVRYVIDFYFDEAKAGTPDAFSVDVRPALDSVENALDRFKMNIYIQFAKWGLPCPITGHSSAKSGGAGPGGEPGPGAAS